VSCPCPRWQFWPIGKPLPEGAKVINDMQTTHHGRYSVLIELADDEGIDVGTGAEAEQE